MNAERLGQLLFHATEKGLDIEATIGYRPDLDKWVVKVGAIPIEAPEEHKETLTDAVKFLRETFAKDVRKSGT